MTMPSYWLERTSLIPEFVATDGAVVTVGDVVQESGVSVQDFTNPVEYQIETGTGETTIWTVTISQPTTFKIPDASFANYLKGLDASLFDENGLLIIANALASQIDKIELSNAADFSGIEFFPNVNTLQCPGYTSTSVDLSRNNKIKLVQYWNADLTEINISNAQGDVYGGYDNTIMINCTAGTKYKRIICQNIKSIQLESSNNELEYIDMRGGDNSGVFVKPYNHMFVSGATVLMDKERWEYWETNATAAANCIKNAPNMTLELYSADGELVDTLHFNE